MFESIFGNHILDRPLSAKQTILCITVGLLLGLVISMVYLLVNTKKNLSSNLALSLIILPAIMTVIIILVGNNIARAFSMAGVFTLIRFRSVPGDSKDITFIFLTVAAGLSAGLGYLTLAAVITVFLSGVILIFSKIGYGKPIIQVKRLKIMIPEDLNYSNAFEDIFERFTKSHQLEKVKTTNLGTLFELTYQVVFKAELSEKDFIDELRSRNGNLTIQLALKEHKDVSL